MVRVASRVLRCAAVAVLLLAATDAASAQDPASSASYPQAKAQKVRKAVRVRQPAVKKSAKIPVPSRRPVKTDAKREPPKLAAMPLPPQRPGEPKPKSEAAAPLPIPAPTAKVASAPPQEPARKEEPAPTAPPIKEGGPNAWRVVTDPATGIVIGIPRRHLTEMHEAPHGTRWSAAHGEIQLETFRLAEPGLTLAAFFERMKREPANRKVEFNALKDD